MFGKTATFVVGVLTMVVSGMFPLTADSEEIEESANKAQPAQGGASEQTDDASASPVKGTTNGKYLRTFVLTADGSEPDWSRSSAEGTTKTWLSDKGPDQALSCKILGFAEIPLFTRDGESADARHGVLRAAGEAYAVHPSFPAKSGFQSGFPLRTDPDKLDKLLVKGELLIQPIEGRPEVIKLSGNLFLWVLFRGGLSSDVIGINASASFMPGVVWTVKQPMRLRVRKDGKDVDLTLSPGTYKLDENSIPKRTQK